ncbi:LPS export ABC transporter permease LptF, partial [Yersinia pestis subsp. pestis]|nr:LPS export ABC transporter permease LptF [Yersinia pestis subsp. pestis]
DPLVWMWAVNGAYLALAIILNLWDGLMARKLRARLRGAA